MADGYVKVYRSLLDWEWYTDVPTRSLFEHLRLSVNWKPGKWMGIDVPAGSIVTSYPKLASGCGLTEKQVRRALANLVETGEVAVSRAGLGQLVALRNWDKFQGDDETGAGPGQKQGRTGAGAGQEKGSYRRREEGKKGRREEPEPNGSVPSGQLPIDGMPPPPPKIKPRGPDPDVQEVVDYLTEKVVAKGLAPALDPPEGKNRQYAHLLITKLAKDYPDHNPVDVACRLVDFALGDPRHAPRCTKVAFLFYNAGTLAAEAKAKKSNPRTQSDGDRKLELAERLADFARRSAGDV